MKKAKQIIAIGLVIFNSLLSLSQNLEYSAEIVLPESTLLYGSGGSSPIDIYKTDNKIFVYTLQRILVYNSSMTSVVGEIPLSGQEYGRYSLQLYSFHKASVDFNLMTYDNINDKLYFVSPNLTVLSINPDSIENQTPQVELLPPQQVYRKTLHANSKLVYDNNTSRLYWFFRSKESDLHSFDSYLGVYRRNADQWDTIYYEYLNDTNYSNLISTFEYNTFRNNFYISRKRKVEVWKIENNIATNIATHATTQERNGKLVVVENNNIQKLLVFPFLVSYDDSINQIHKIYQINTVSPSLMDSINSPSKRIFDAIYIPWKKEVMVCYGNDNLIQTNPDNKHEISLLNYLGNKFIIHNSLNTQTPYETDTTEKNNNYPFKLLQRYDSSVLVSKKNEILELSYSEINGYNVSNRVYNKDNFFYKSIQSGTKSLIMNPLYGVDYITDEFGFNHGRRTLNFPVYETEYNPISRKLYLYNRLSADNTGFYIYDLESEQLEGFVECEKAIGDLAFNPINNHILVSEYARDRGNGVIINIYDGISGEYISNISVSGNDYASEIFISPLGKIYVAMNMKNDETVPKISIFDSKYYLKIGEDINTAIPISDSIYNSNGYQMHFCYNDLNSKVYLTVGPTNNVPPPYYSSSNSIVRLKSDPTDHQPIIENLPYNAKIIELTENNIPGNSMNLQLASKIVFGKDYSRLGERTYEGSIYLNHKNNSGEMIKIFDCSDFSEQGNVSFGLAFELVDMVYCPLTASCYAYVHEYVEGGQQIPDSSKIHIYRIYEDATIKKIWQKHGFGGSLSYNPYDSRLYLYYRSDEQLLGSDKAMVFTLNPFAETIVSADSVVLPHRSLIPDMFPYLNKPHFDAYNNSAYFPNGMHSSVSKLNFTPMEALPLIFDQGDKSIEWFSIPRMLVNNTVSWDEADTIETVFDRENFRINYDEFLLEHSDASNNGFSITNEWSMHNFQWTHIPESNLSVWSYRGYIMDMDTTAKNSNNHIYMYGDIKEPLTSFPLYHRQSNWTGYFLEFEQDIFDALGPTTLSLINRIEHQDYWCEKRQGTIPYGPVGGSHGQTESWYWMCEKQSTQIKYGQMVKLYSANDSINGFDLITWQNEGSLPKEKIRPEPEYFKYAQLSEYTPIVIELDYATNPLEIGAFAGDSCRGATTVLSEDSVVYMRAYLGGNNPDSLVFEDWDGTKSDDRNIIRDYKVYNKHTNIYEYRPIVGNPGNEIVRISFRKDSEDDIENVNNENISGFNIWPNPASEQLYYSFYSEKQDKYIISIISIQGVKQGADIIVKVNKGYNKGIINLSNGYEQKLETGFYIISLKGKGVIKVKKLIIN